MIIRFQDNENNETLLKVNGNLAFKTISALCKDHFLINDPTRKIDDMLIIEWGIRQQLLTLLTDEEVDKVNQKTTSHQ